MSGLVHGARRPPAPQPTILPRGARVRHPVVKGGERGFCAWSASTPSHAALPGPQQLIVSLQLPFKFLPLHLPPGASVHPPPAPAPGSFQMMLGCSPRSLGREKVTFSNQVHVPKPSGPRRLSPTWDIQGPCFFISKHCQNYPYEFCHSIII